MLIYTAPWVIPISEPAISDGAVLVSNGHIMAVAPFEDIKRNFPVAKVKYLDGVLMPSLVNAHMHLELSHLDYINRPAKKENICDWITELLKERFEVDQKTNIREIALEFIKKQHKTGVSLIGDIGNIPGLLKGETEGVKLLSFLEFIAPTKKAEQEVLTQAKSLASNIIATVHSPYSCTSNTIKEIAKRSVEKDHVLSVHIAESADEIKFLKENEGCFKEFFKTRGGWDGSFIPADDLYNGSVSYLNYLGVLNENCLCIHCVHLVKDEIKLIADTGASICLCPRSNKFLRVGTAPLELMLESGILPAIGTDSIASNWSLDLWEEMKTIASDYPEIPNEIILKMATLGGARALNLGEEYGALRKGYIAQFLNVNSWEIRNADSIEEVNNILVSSGQPNEIVTIKRKNESLVEYREL